MKEKAEQLRKNEYLSDSNGMISEAKLAKYYKVGIYFMPSDTGKDDIFLMDMKVAQQRKYLQNGIHLSFPKSEVKIDGIRFYYQDEFMFNYQDLIDKGIIEPIDN